MPHIVSTLASDVAYTGYISNTDGGPNVPNRRVLVKGGHGVANQKHALANGILTPDGVATKVTDEDLEFLKSNHHFQQHEKKGFVKVLKISPSSPAGVAKNMEGADGARPLTNADFQPGGRAAMPKHTEDAPWGVKTATLQ